MTANLVSACVDLNNFVDPSFAFAYHMYGSSMGTLSIEVSTDSGTTWIQEWSLSGNQGNQWYETYIDLSAYTSNISVRIKGVTGNSFRSDMAVDLVRFTEMPNFGCTNPLALNYDSTAVCDDGSCIATVLGCIDSLALNYDVFANSDDGSCEYESCAGCLNPDACNYDADAIYPADCEFPEQYYNCDGNCVNDSDEDGICDELEILGCNDESACNLSLIHISEPTRPY